MKKFLFAACAATLLSACGERGASSQTGEKPAPDAAQVQADVDAAQEAATAAIDDAERNRAEAHDEIGAPRRVAGYKRTMLALIAGSYAGDCRTRSGALARGAVAVDADGRVSAPGMPARSLMDPDSQLTLSIKGSHGEPSEITFMGGSEAARWNVSSQRKGDLSTVYVDKGNPIKCVDTRPPAQGRVATLYQALAPHFAAGGGTLACSDGKARPHTMRVTPSAGALRVGNETFTLDDSDADEVASVSDEAILSYQRDTADGRRIAMTLNGAGRIEKLSVSGYRGVEVGHCERPAR